MSPRGGYRRPRSPFPVSPPGALSRRTDQGRRVPANTPLTKQPIRTPSISSTIGGVTDVPLQQGDVSRLRAAQEAQPLPAVPGPQAPSPQEARASLAGVKPGESLLFRPSDRPDEPVTAGLQGPALPQVLGAAQLAGALEEIVQTGPVSKSLMDLYIAARTEARYPSTQFSTPRGPVPAFMLGSEGA